MYKSYPPFIEPDNENIKIWRYLDFTKLISIISNRTLHFTRADQFEDPFEGSTTKANIKMRWIYPLEFKKEDIERYELEMEKLSIQNQEMLRYHAINCWHMNEFESAAMWKLYLLSNEGVAIQSTFKRLKNSITDSRAVLIGKVNYIDYDSKIFNDENIFSVFLHKRLSYKHEEEIRAVVPRWPIKDDKLDFSYDTIYKSGLDIAVDLNILIEKIFVCPKSPSWLLELVKKVVQEDYHYNFEVIQSDLSSSPLY